MSTVKLLSQQHFRLQARIAAILAPDSVYSENLKRNVRTLADELETEEGDAHIISIRLSGLVQAEKKRSLRAQDKNKENAAGEKPQKSVQHQILDKLDELEDRMAVLQQSIIDLQASLGMRRATPYYMHGSQDHHDHQPAAKRQKV
jgi:uncharacterized small protein (DUF1192 family)